MRQVNIAVAIVAVLVVSCARPTENKAPAQRALEGYAVPAAGSLVLVAGDDGSLRPWGNQERFTRSFPLARSPMVQPLGNGAIIAINRVGFKRIRIARGPASTTGSPAEARIVIDTCPGAETEFAGRTVSSSWANRDDAYFLLFRHPVYELEAPRVPQSVVLVVSASGARILEPGIGPDAYAAFPASPKSWLVQSRSETPDRVSTAYANIDPSSGTSTSLSRGAFEKLASPAPMASAPASIRAAADALSGPLLVETRLPDGSRRTYARGDPGEAAPAWGQELASAEGLSISVIVTDDWRAALARTSSGNHIVSVLNPEPPIPDARVRDVALIDGILVIAWEEDLFPDVGFCGLVALDPGL